ncbi:mPR-typeG-protein-coupled receptor [Leptodontidium sp. MPI-SDFR-AT-0119]|nr:mPR-typeG-protein-coupled receptor [Leptodontidium sp. MPI-SDFR-AT-0119]
MAHTLRQPRIQSGHYLLLRWNDLPSWQQDNEFILTRYRPVSGSFQKSLSSLKHVHNEIVNIYSYLLGAVLFVILVIYMYARVHNYHAATQIGDIIGFVTFFFGVILCFSLSFDYLGIVILIWGSTIPSVYYGFYCDPKLQNLYWAVVSVLAVVCTMATLSPKFRHLTLRLYRTVIYASLGLSAVVFITHGLIIYGWETQNRRISLTYILIAAMLNLLGAIVYVVRILERWHQLRYDIYGCSHQILHFIVVFAGLIYMFGLLSAFSFIHSQAHLCA